MAKANASTNTKTEPKPKRDKRIDQLLLLGDLGRMIETPLKDEMKEQYEVTRKEPLVLLKGDIAEGRIELVEGASINTERFYAAFKRGDISEKDFLECISVAVGKVEKALGENELGKYLGLPSTKVNFTVKRIKGTNFNLADAITAAQKAGAKPPKIAVKGKAA